MRLGLASLLVALLLFSPSQPASSTSSPSSTLEDDANARFLALHAPSSSTTSTKLYPIISFKADTSSSNEDIQHNDLDVGHRLFDEDDEKYTPEYVTTYSADQKKRKLASGNLKKSEPLHKKKEIVVGYLTAATGDLRDRQGLAVSGAFTMALNEVNQDPNILPNVTLVMRWNDTKGDTVMATRAMTDMICEGVSAFFGPEGTCHVEAIVAQSRNIPMISYKCSDYKASQVPTFARTEPPDTQVTKSVVSLLDYYRWYKFTIVYEDAWYTVAQSLVQEAGKKNMTINDIRSAEDYYKCCEKDLSCCASGYWYQFIQETKNRTRIYVFLGSLKSLLDLMMHMQTSQLFEHGEYIVIYVDTDTYSEREAHKYIWKNYEKFTEQVRLYNSKEPFYFETSVFLKSFETYVSIYAAYLYDSFKLYASALHNLLTEQPVLNDSIIDEIAKNGTRIVEAIIKMKTYRSITGATMKLDQNGDSEGNFSVLAFQRVSGDQHVHGNFSCPYQMRPVGQFFQQSDAFPEYKIYANAQIEWPGNDKPNDEPSCGFNNELCPKPNTHLNSIIAAGVLAILLFCAGVITMSIYRKWKIEQEIEGLLWKIDRNEIHSYFERDIVSSPSRLSLISASVTSYESRGGLQVFAATAQYRGVVVRIKELTFSRKKDISRDVMKEMRLLRELRHDNINSFIGACVEPTSLLLVTDYCAKGSLYDIIENEDIKLDKMFVASLVHDLIKGMLYIHNSMLICHGNLKSSNCVVTSRWVLQVTDFGLAEMRHCAESDSIGEHQYYRSLFWKAPEILRNPNAYCRGTQKGDVYAFAIILYEILGRKGPFGTTGYEPKDIIDLVKRVPFDGDECFRPDVDLLIDCEIGCDDYVIQCMKDCWTENPESRPDFATIRSRLKRMKDGKSKNIMDQMMDMMVTYANNLEEIVTERTRLLYEEKMKTEDLLHRMLPKPVAERLTMGYGVEPESFDLVTIYFSDIVGFTAMSAESTPLQVVNFLNDLYTVFDRIIKGYDVYKVETIGDAYMVVSGLPLRNNDRHAGEIASMALDLLSAVKNHSISHRPKEVLKLRIGIHTGPVVAGVVGLTMPRYCLFGDTVNTASRMESNGEPLKIHISLQCKEALDKLGGYIIEDRGLVNMKGKGEVRTFWLTGATDQAVQKREVDLGDIPPLFCRPRRSPKLNNESRQASVCGGFGGMNSRRHSSVPRGTSVEVESTSTLQNSSPLPMRHLKVNRHNLHVPEQGSKLTINTAFGSQIIENSEESRRGLRPRRVLSSIASSSDEQKKSQNMLNKIRESKSLDPLPLVRNKPETVVDGKPLEFRKRSTRSLENCDKCGEVQIIAIPDDKLINNNFPNGNILSVPAEENNYIEDVQVPLLNTTQHPIVRRRGGSGIDDTLQNNTSKKWRSLESLPATCDPVTDIQNKKKASLKSWLVGLFNGNGLKASNTSLRKGVINEYNNLTEKESIV
ncbi:guanylate cyclase 32E [Asbolus verrucosus]|uniref:Guanylate cyclase n=1 Tax=Asbolus verrucosus TaxID=1661398 RepID=A0A482VLY3_ASBVE|nr:guanylate cyclase 32E [Asbolus verrucosus]